MTNTIKHQGVVESINDSLLRVRIVQTSACTSCSVKGHCSSADSKEKVIEIINSSTIYRIGEEVMIIGTTSMGVKAVILAFVVPFFLLVFSLFVLMALINNDLLASLFSLATLIPYYMVLWLLKSRLKQQFSFTIKPINN
ncbi:MAG: SoxR reducing system RseC family protein [Bacteroides sp.]